MPETIRTAEGLPVTRRHQLFKEDGAAVVQADVYDITVRVFDLSSSTPSTATVEYPLVITDVVFDTMQTGSDWTVDTTGYNFKGTLDGSWFPKGGRVYRVEITTNITSGAPITPTAPLTDRFDVNTGGGALSR